MKLAGGERTIERTGISAEASFSVKATGKAFRILSSGLYKDKILAIVRELSCNAYDAHVAGGNSQEPFFVHLPNLIEPYFAIRDFGIGLSHDDVMTLYATYFESTKSDSNDYIGALGLGSKSPFSYVDSFTVVSFFNGRKSSYACYINEVDCPVVTRMNEEVTKERNGLEVRIPVEKRMDFTLFRDRAQEIYRLFEPCPDVRGDASFRITKPEVFMEQPGCWRLHKDASGRDYANGNRYGYSMSRDAGVSAAKAIMGKIAYPISASSIPHLPQNLQQLLNCDLHIDFALGDLEFTAGREELSYDQRTTIPALRRRLEEVSKEIGKALSEVMTPCATEFEARKKFRELQQTGILTNVGVTYLTWRGKRIDTPTANVDIGGIGVEVYLVSKSSYYNPIYSKLEAVKNPHLNFDCMALPMFVTKDTADKASARVRITHMMKTSPRFTTYGSSVVLIEGETAELEKMRDKLPGLDLVDVLTLEKPPSKPKTKIKYKALPPDGNTHPGFLSEVEIDLEDGGYYVLTANGKIKDGTSHETFQSKYLSLCKLGKIPDDVKTYVVPVSVSQKIVDHEDWFEIQPWLEERAKEVLADASIQRAIAIGNSFKALQGNIGDYALKNAISNWAHLVQKLPPDHEIAQFVAIASAQQKAIASGDPQAKLIQSFPNCIATTPVSSPGPAAPDLQLLYASIMRNYPMFEYAPQAAYSNSKTVLGYVQMVDRANNTSINTVAVGQILTALA